MNEINPDKWMIIKITGRTPHYRLFGSWSGGYLGNDEWRMNSGIVGVEDDGTNYLVHGESGSVYICSKHGYGVTAYGYGIAKRYEEKLAPNFIILDEQPDFENMDWIINK